MMREDNLLCVRRRTFIVTTDSRHHLPVYPNLAAQITPAAINQLWVADIYIRLRTREGSLFRENSAGKLGLRKLTLQHSAG
jgi:transposase InsO family protein